MSDQTHIKALQLSATSGQRTPRDLFIFLLVILSLWNLAGGSVPAADHQGQDTEMASLAITDTVQPSETPSPYVTETVTPASETPTEEPPSPTPTETIAVDRLVGAQSPGGEFETSEVLVRFRRHATDEDLEQCIQSVNATITSEIEELDTLVLALSTEEYAESMTRLSSCPGLRYVEPNHVVQIADRIPSDPGWPYQYGLTKIRAPQGWELDTGSSSVTIAIIDTGIAYTHPDLVEKIVPGIDIINGDNNPYDDHGHGTLVAGIAAASSNNGIGIAGVSWGAKLMPIKVLDAAGYGTYVELAEGIIWAVDHGAQVINLSVGGTDESQLLQDAVDYAASRSVVLVAAAGNEGINSVSYPARYPNVIAVAATDSSNSYAAFSNYGPEVDLSAPGVSIVSTRPGGYGYGNGTSMATPYVSGLAAILRGIPGNDSPAAIAQQMTSTALDLGLPGWDDFYGYGLIQMDAAIQSLWGVPPPVSFPAKNTPSTALLNLSDGFVNTLTVSPSPTDNSLLTPSETATALPTFTFTDTPAFVVTGTPEVIALEAQIPEEAAASNWFLPGCGLSLILAGIALFWMAQRERKKNRKVSIRFR